MNTLAQFKNHVAGLTGSSATTPKGILASWRKHRASYPQVSRFGARRAHRQTHLIITWKREQSERTSDPELKRAAKDKVFRHKLIAKLRREAKRLAKPVASALDLVGLKGRINLLRGVNLTLEGLGSKPVPEPAWPPYRLMDFDLTQKQIKALRNKIGGSALDTAQWKYEPGFTNRVAAHVYSESTKRNGRWWTVAHSDHRIEYQSFGVILEGGHVWETLIDGEVKRHVLPDDTTVTLTHNPSALYVYVKGLTHPYYVRPAGPSTPPPDQWREAAFNHAAMTAFAP